MRLIDADALKKAIIKYLCVKSENNLLPAEKSIYNLIDEQPTVEPEQPKVLSKEDVAKHDVVWMETNKDEIFPVLVDGATGDPKSELHYFIHLYGVGGHIEGFPVFLYNRTWRCWTNRPTNNVRMNTPWKDGEQE